MIAWIIGNSIVAAAAAIVVALICRYNRSRPEVCHSLWLVVFGLLVMPPLPITGLPGEQLHGAIQSRLASSEVAEIPVEASPDVAPGLTQVFAPNELINLTNQSAVLSTGELPIVEEPSNLESTHPILSGATTPSPTPQLAEPLAPAFTALIAAALIGLFLATRFSLRLMRFHRRVTNAPLASESDPNLAAAIARVASRLRVPVPEVRLIEGIGSPAVWCLGRPRLLWPASSNQAVEPTVIAHELAHIARRDTWVARLEPLAAALLFWNPIFWIVRHQVRTYAELSCDAWALWAYPDARRAYAEALVGSHDQNRTAPLAVRGLCATHPNVKDLERRLTLIMKKQVNRGASKGLLFAAALGALIVAPGMSQDAPVRSAASPEVSVGALVTRTDNPVVGALAHQGWRTIGKDNKFGAKSRPSKERIAEAQELMHLANAEGNSGNVSAAIELMEKSLIVDPTNDEVHSELGFMAISSGDISTARKHFKAQVKLGLHVDTGLYNLACCESLDGNVKQGIEYLGAAIRAGFDDSDLMAKDEDLESLHGTRAFDAAVKLSAILREQRHLAGKAGAGERFTLLETIAKIASDDGASFDELGMAHHDKGDYEKSLKCFKRQAELGVATGRAYYNQGCALARLGQRETALKMLFKSAASGFSYAQAASDADLVSLREDPAYVKAIKALSGSEKSQAKREAKTAKGTYQALKGLGYLGEEMDNEPTLRKLGYVGEERRVVEQQARAMQIEAEVAQIVATGQVAEARALLAEAALAASLDPALKYEVHRAQEALNRVVEGNALRVGRLTSEGVEPVGEPKLRKLVEGKAVDLIGQDRVLVVRDLAKASMDQTKRGLEERMKELEAISAKLDAKRALIDQEHAELLAKYKAAVKQLD